MQTSRKSFVVTDDVVTATTLTPMTKREKRQAVHEHRKASGLCVQCGKKLQQRIETTRCARCKKRASRAAKRWRKRNPDKVTKQRAWLKADRAKHSEKHKKMRRLVYRKMQRAKICTKCKASAVPGSTLCQPHIDQSRAYSRAYYLKNGRKRRRQRQTQIARAKHKRFRRKRCSICKSDRHTKKNCGIQRKHCSICKSERHTKKNCKKRMADVVVSR
jgi:hypothetical protein